MAMDYARAMELFFECKRSMELLEAEAALKKAPFLEKMNLLTQWMQEKARLDGLKNVPVAGVGTGYFRTTTTCRVANKTDFRAFAESKDLWELVEIRASAAEVKKYIEKTGAVPPGVNFGQIETFHIRGATEKE